MKFTPHWYQVQAIQFILQHPVAALFLDMGLGKTVITLTAISQLMMDSFQVRRVLVIAPLRVAAHTWPEEVRKWDHLRGITLAVAVGDPKQRRAAITSTAQIVVINQENVAWLQQSGLPFDFDMVVIDEMSSFKSAQSQRFRAMLKLRPSVKRILGLTGTPTSNSLMDLWAQYRILDHGERLGRFIGAYRQAYFTPGARRGMVVFNYTLQPGAEERIYRQIDDITLGMQAVDHLSMPELVRINLPVVLPPSSRRAYDQLKKQLVATLPEGEISAVHAGALMNKLSQMASGAVYMEDGSTSSLHEEKLGALEELIQSANGQPVLVAYWFRHELIRIQERLAHLGLTFGELRGDEDIHRWNARQLQVGLIHPASAGHGLNLQSGGHVLIWFSLPWSLELYQQTNARLWRQGQQSGRVVIYHLLAEGTVDQRILQALEKKEITQEQLLAAVKEGLT